MCIGDESELCLCREVFDDAWCDLIELYREVARGVLLRVDGVCGEFEAELEWHRDSSSSRLLGDSPQGPLANSSPIATSVELGAMGELNGAGIIRLYIG